MLPRLSQVPARFGLVALGILFSLLSFSQEAPLWMRYPSISPDGSTIVFSYKGDLFTVPSGGGDASILTIHAAHDFNPVWSSDGQNIAFASDRYGNYDVFVVPKEGGRPKRLTYHSNDDIPSDFTSDNKHVIFSSKRVDDVNSAQFPYGRLPELYRVSAQGGRAIRISTTAVQNAQYDKSGKLLIYHDQKGYEDPWRKHHTSSITRDIWALDVANKAHKQLTTFKGEDRNPVWSGDEQHIYYLSEKSGSFNVWKLSILDPDEKSQVTKLDKHPVRFLSMATNGVMCFGYNGEIYTMKDGEEPLKVVIKIVMDDNTNDIAYLPLQSSIDEMAVSPNGKEIAFIIRGEVFATSVDHKRTKRITNTPEMERSVSFSPDGKHILYASERNGSWNIYQTSRQRKEEPYFYMATALKESTILATDAETFQPAYSPDGKEIAYLEERTTLKVLNLATSTSRVVMSGDNSYSYIDGDQHYDWSPDSKWLLVNFMDRQRWDREVGLVSAKGGKITNISNSGYGDYAPRWALDGKAVMYFSDKFGHFRHSGRGSEDDVMALFFSREAFDRMNLSEEELALVKEGEKDKKASTTTPTLRLELDGLDNRLKRLTPKPTWLADAAISPDGEKVYYLSQSAKKGYDLWSHDLYKGDTEKLTNLGGSGEIHLSEDGKTIFASASGKLYKVEAKGGKKTPISFSAEMVLDETGERAFFFEHIWRQVKKKFYKKDLHGVDWEFYKAEYARFLPHINNTRDYAEMCSELLGELNASHTGARYRVSAPKDADKTSSLGLLFDDSHTGKGLKIAEVLVNSPLDIKSSKAKTGMIIEKIDGVDLDGSFPEHKLLNRKAGQYTLLSMYDPSTRSRWEERIKPISLGAEYGLLYNRWVKSREDAVEKLSNGRLGYVHVRGMNDGSFRVVYDKVLGKYYDREALIVDIRFNGGGNLHDQLCVFLDGEKYYSYFPRGQAVGIVPSTRWTKPSIVIQGEGSYSDAHLFPYAYKALEIGKLLGMPVPGTGTSVWWENLYVGVRFGIPEVGYRGNDGSYTENQELVPDIQVKNEYDKIANGQDQQLEAAIEELLKQLDDAKKAPKE